MKVDIQKEENGKYTAFGEDRGLCWTDADTEEEAIKGLKKLYPNEEYEISK